ncbi:MAG: serine--tRNA ligase [Bacteroidota bacterium]
MLELSLIRTEPERVVKGLEAKLISDAQQQVAAIIQVDKDHRQLLQQVESARAELKKSSKSIGSLIKSGNTEEAEAAKARVGSLKEDIKSYEGKIKVLIEQLHDQLVALPNLPHESVTFGKSPEDNVTVLQNGEEVKFDFTPKPHWELATSLGIIDWELGVKLTGSGFPVYLGKGAALQRALIQFFLAEASKAGYLEVMPPLVVNEDSGYATGQLPDKEGQMYHITEENLYLIPTAEVPITNLYRNVILKDSKLPVKHCGYTPCFRREAGSYGKEVRGLNRLHQFDKVELVQITAPEHSYQTLEEMTQHVMGLLDMLGLPYRQLLLCTGDMSFASAKTYDLEVFSAAQERWLEVSSVSNFEVFQSNRMKLRWRSGKDKPQLAHTLNGSALALPRILAALLENNQQADGSVSIPEVLRPFTGFDSI